MCKNNIYSILIHRIKIILIVGGNTLNDQRRELIKNVYSALKNGEISRGNKLFPERELAEKFHVTRATLREALISLEALGIIEIRERQGIFIGGEGINYLTNGMDIQSSSSPADLLTQVYEVRTMLETSAAELAAKRRNDRDISLLKEEIEFFKYLDETNHPEKGPLGSQHNRILHCLIINATHNHLLQRIYEGISKLSQNTIVSMGKNGFHHYAKWPHILLKEHENIVKAIIQGDHAQAKAMTILHLKNSKIRSLYAENHSKYFIKNN